MTILQYVMHEPMYALYALNIVLYACLKVVLYALKLTCVL
jgi:hypothetical protein